MATFAEFQESVKRIGWIFGLATAGAVFAPLLAAAAEISPPTAPSIPFITSLFMLVGLLLSFALLAPLAKRRIRRWLLGSAVVFIIGFATYLYFFGIFVFVPAETGRPLVLGCGLTTEARAMAEIGGLDPRQPACPGPFAELLRGVNNNAADIWLPTSIHRIGYALLLGWTISFASLAVLVTAFVLSLTRDRPGRGRPSVEAPPTNA